MNLSTSSNKKTLEKLEAVKKLTNIWHSQKNPQIKLTKQLFQLR